MEIKTLEELHAYCEELEGENWIKNKRVKWVKVEEIGDLLRTRTETKFTILEKLYELSQSSPDDLAFPQGVDKSGRDTNIKQTIIKHGLLNKFKK